jgi:hypothetical protein
MQVKSEFLLTSDSAREMWDSYRSVILKIIRIHESSAASQVPKYFTARVALSLSWLPDQPHLMPVITSSVIDTLHNVLSQVPLAITEVSRATFSTSNGYYH